MPERTKKAVEIVRLKSEGKTLEEIALILNLGTRQNVLNYHKPAPGDCPRCGRAFEKPTELLGNQP